MLILLDEMENKHAIAIKKQTYSRLGMSVTTQGGSGRQSAISS